MFGLFFGGVTRKTTKYPDYYGLGKWARGVERSDKLYSDCHGLGNRVSRDKGLVTCVSKRFV